MTSLRILSYNIHGGRNLFGKRDIRSIHALLDHLDADIIVIQEMETRPSRSASPDDVALLSGPDRPHHVIGASMEEGEGWFGNLIASRHPILQSQIHNLETGPDLEPRNAVDALIDTPIGLLRVLGTHLSLSYLERRSEARNLLRLMREVEEYEAHPVLLLGDINEWQWPSRLLRFLNGEMTALPCGATFPSFAPVFHLDRAWHDKMPEYFHITAHRVFTQETRTASDHLPIIVSIENTKG